MKIFKTCLIILAIVSSLIFSGLYYLSLNPIKIHNNSLQTIINHFYQGVKVDKGQVILTSVNFKLKFFANELILSTEKQALIKLENFELLWNVLTFSGRMKGDLKESDLLKLATSEDINIQNHINNFNKMHSILFNGMFSIKFRFFAIHNANLEFNNIKGIFDPKTLKPINLDNIKISLYFKNNILSVKNLAIQYENNLRIGLHGDFVLKNAQILSAQFQTSINQLPVSYLVAMWPEFVFPEARQWIKDHVKEGVVNSAIGKVNFAEKDKKILKDSISAEIGIINAEVNYDNNFSPIKDVDALIKIDGESLQVKASKALFFNNKVNGFELVLPFDSLLLSIRANLEGKIADFKEFVPVAVQNKLKNSGIAYNDIQGMVRGAMAFKLPIDKDFDVKNMSLEIKAQLEDVVFDKLALIRVKKADLEIVNEADKIQVKIKNDHSSLLHIVHHHNEEEVGNNMAQIDMILDVHNALNFKNLLFTGGFIKVKAQASPKEWQATIDLTNAEITLTTLAFTKKKHMKALLDCQGKLEEKEIIGDECKLSGENFQGKASFVVSRIDNNLKNLNLENIKLGSNIFTFGYKSDGAFSNSYIKAKNLDLSNVVLSKGAHSNYYFSYQMDNVLLKNDIKLTDMKGYVSKAASNRFLDLSMHATVGNDKIVVSKAVKNNKTFYAFHSSSAASFFKAFNIYKNIKKGELLAEIYPENDNDQTYYSGNLEVRKFYLSNSSFLTKIILGVLSPLNSPQAMAQSLQGGSLPADSFKTNFTLKDDRFTLSGGVMNGPSYQVKINGYADFNSETLQFKGIYIPSFYGINTFISMIPLFGKLLTGGDKSAFIAANFEVNGSFAKPVTRFNPLSIFTPGFLRNFFN